ncbi:MAG: insulinase family protein [Cyanobacteria bacterium SZAS LIN-3]|nr:insulinase family protein [Cyanobacteria bacterium SZAS LIN-3]
MTSKTKKSSATILTDELLSTLGIERVCEAQGIVEYRLKSNGLKVLLAENHATPNVSTMILYRVGSRNEAVGYTGATHFLEHMMFKGTDKFDYVASLKPLGGTFNATTSYDRTNYFAKVPSKGLPLVIEMEADRMRNLVLRKEHRDSEMSVVHNELDNGKNNPFSAVREQLMAVSLQQHPYHHPVIGYALDVENVPLERLQAFYNEFYYPNNAAFMVSGDFNSADALKQIAQHFGPLPASPHPIPQVYTYEPAQEGVRRFEVSRVSTFPQFTLMGFRTPGAAHKDNLALAAISAILGSSDKPASRLYKAAIATGKAVEVFCMTNSLKDEGPFMIGGVMGRGGNYDELEQILLGELKKFADEPVSEEELNRTKAGNRKATDIGTDNAMALLEQLCQAEVEEKWQRFFTYDDDFDGLTADDIQRVARKYFTAKNMTVGRFIQEKPPLQAAPEVAAEADTTGATTAATEAATAGDETSAPATTVASFKKRTTVKKLPNGLTVQILPMPLVKTVAVSLTVQAGNYLASAEKSLVPTLTAQMLNKGSKNASKEEAGQALDDMKSGISFSNSNYSVAMNGKVVAKDLGKYITYVADMLRNPLFLQEELDLVMEEMHTNLSQQLDDNDAVAGQRMAAELFPKDSPLYDKPFEEVLAELETITVDDLRQYHGKYYSPKSTVITIAGAVEADEVMQILTLALGSWQGDKAPAIKLPAALERKAATKTVVHLDNKESATIIVALPTTTAIGTKEFFTAKIANAALGEDTIDSRLGRVIRKEKGLTYGVYSSFQNPYFGSGAWVIELTTANDKVDEALALVHEIVAKYAAEGISQAEFEQCIDQAESRFTVGLDGPSPVASTMNLYTFLGMGIEMLDELPKHYRGVSRDEVNAYIRKNFDLTNAATIIVGSV